jgi:sulfoxide reductase heme-binding subunit YedZ
VSLPVRQRFTLLPILRAVVFVAALLPALRLVLWPILDLAGANPIEFVTRSSGTWALALLCATLAMTPLRRLTGWPHWLRLRRMLGLYTFFYACLHVATWVWLDQWFDLPGMLRELIERPYLTVGALAFALMLPLALTSTDAMIRRLGRRWGLLHRLIHPIALLAILHFAWHKSPKNDYAEVAVYAAVILVLLALRLIWRLEARRRAAP